MYILYHHKQLLISTYRSRRIVLMQARTVETALAMAGKFIPGLFRQER